MNRSRRALLWILITVAMPLNWADEAAANPAMPRSTSRPNWSSSSRSNAPAHRASAPARRSSPVPQRSLPATPRATAPVVRSSPSVQYSAPRTTPAPQPRCYTVYYRTCPQSPWIAYGCYYDRSDAQQGAAYFQSMGYETFIR